MPCPFNDSRMPASFILFEKSIPRVGSSRIRIFGLPTITDASAALSRCPQLRSRGKSGETFQVKDPERPILSLSPLLIGDFRFLSVNSNSFSSVSSKR